MTDPATSMTGPTVQLPPVADPAADRPTVDNPLIPAASMPHDRPSGSPNSGFGPAAPAPPHDPTLPGPAAFGAAAHNPVLAPSATFGAPPHDVTQPGPFGLATPGVSPHEPTPPDPTTPGSAITEPLAPVPAADGPAPTDPLRSHRRAALPDNRWGRAGRRLVAAVLVIATLAVGRWIIERTPDDDGMQKPFIRTAATGVPVDVRAFDAEVLSVRGAARIDVDGHPHDTSGVWILVKLRLTARGEPTTLEYAAVVDDEGRVYRATARVDQPLVGGRTLQPGVPVTGEIAFEVPVAVAGELSVRLAPNDLDQRMDAMAEVRLPVSASEVAAWRADTRPATLAPAVAG